MTEYSLDTGAQADSPTLDLPDDVGDMSPAAKLVYLCVLFNEPVSMTEIKSAMDISDTTVSQHLQTLHDSGLLSRRRDPMDPRRRLYRVE